MIKISTVRCITYDYSCDESMTITKACLSQMLTVNTAINARLTHRYTSPIVVYH